MHYCTISLSQRRTMAAGMDCGASVGMPLSSKLAQASVSAASNASATRQRAMFTFL